MKEWKVYQIDCKIYLLKNIKLTYLLAEIAAFVDSALAMDKKMLEFHLAYGYKNYVISGLKELEGDKCYKEGKIYSFSVRCVKEELCNFLMEKLADAQTDAMKGLTAEVKIIPKLWIEKLYTVTPALIKVSKKGYWKGSLSFEEYEKRLFLNSVKKYKQLSGEDIDENFSLYHRIQMLNRKPIANKYKGICFLGDKLELAIAENEMAQTIAYMLLGVGLLENNSRAYGYLNFRALQ